MTGRDTTEVRPRTRRAVLAAVGTGGALTLAGCLGGDDDETDDDGLEAAEDLVRIGASIPESGDRRGEGELLREGYEMAVRDINDGDGATTAAVWDDIDQGVHGHDLAVEFADTGSSRDGARQAATELVDIEGADVLTGGASRAEGIGHQEAASDTETLYLGGYTPSNALAGEFCSSYSFNQMPNSTLIARALEPVVIEEFGDEFDFVQLYPDSDAGQEFRDTMRTTVEDEFAQERNQLATESTRVGTRDFEEPVADALSRTPDVVILNYYGVDGAAVLRETVSQIAERDDEIAIVVPLLNHPLLENAADSLAGVIGTMPWTDAYSDINMDEFTAAFRESWADFAGEDSPTTPPALVHLAYVQTCQFVAAAERADSLDPDELVDELAGHTYDVGAGEQELRACDRQAIGNVPVVRGLPEAEQADGQFVERIDPGQDAAYGCEEEPAADCDL